MSRKGDRQNGSILNFFRPIPQSPMSRIGSSEKAISHPLPSSSPSLPPLSSPNSHTTPAKANAERLEICASDDEENQSGGSSDDSLEDLSTLLGHGRPMKAAPVPSKTSHNAPATPNAKRTAVEFHSSPLAIIPKPKFDMRALAKDARQDNATSASSMRASALNDPEQQDDEAITTGLRSRETFDIAFVETVRGKGSHDAQKVLRAVQRAEPGQSVLRYCFFDRKYVPPKSAKPPKKLDKSPWRILAEENARIREQHIVSGLPQALLRSGLALPDELFEYLLDELCVEPSILNRQEYCVLIAECPGQDQVERLVSPGRLQELLIRLGAAQHLQEVNMELPLSRHTEQPYHGRDWSCLRSFLTLLRLMSPSLSAQSVEYATLALLRLSLDKMLIQNIDIMNEHKSAIQSLIYSIPSSRWNSFCFEACDSVNKWVKPQCIRMNALLCLPVSQARTHELRRRLAITFLFDDPSLGRHRPEAAIDIRDLIDRMHRPDFIVGPKTDFVELKASVIFLDIAIDDGPYTSTGNPDDEKRFNEDVDELALKLRDVWRKINDSGMKLSRTEAKSVIDWVQQRLSYSVRTRRKPKTNVFDIQRRRGDESLSQQQDVLEKFLKRAPIPSS